MITTDYVPGSPCWLDLGAPDIEADTAFYAAVFGWDTEGMEGPDGEVGFVMLKEDGKYVGAIGKLEERDARSAWMLYFHTADAEATTRAVERLGGTVRVPPTEIPGEGRMAQYTDPQGGQFAVFQPGADGSSGLQLVDESNSLCWTELMTPDAAGARAFYGELFGWSFSDMPMPGGQEGTYTMLTPAGQPEERMHGGLMELPAEALELTGGRAYWHPVFAVEDVDAALGRAREKGGTVQMGPEDAEGVGRLAVVVDGSGADFVLLKPEPMPAR
ncbi:MULTISPECIES: VOC family protein [unclassified Streptomyces]|uniref:VOC family protein n=1 Tax=unclassified Streptomyces TaxID=2593676 RepID=UPI0022B6E37D|nr:MULTISPECIES: VOC family protein [unclassified Streptomyces]MCZ7415121.1 VOC family protein [Streptomyces sp. WMMC897]MCZ7432064.1 VOC family protein [Streptomyces sp. WMMC1477]